LLFHFFACQTTVHTVVAISLRVSVAPVEMPLPDLWSREEEQSTLSH
jgi:hypothetical protein